MSEIINKKIEDINILHDENSTIEVRRGYPILLDKDFYLPNVKIRINKNYISIYVIRSKNGKKYSTSIGRYVLGVVDNSIEVDHINGNTLDNRKYNLRIATQMQNSWNRVGHSIINKFKGYSIKKKEIRIWCTKEGIRYGYSMHVDKCSEQEAALLYDCLSITLHGDFGNTNYPRESYTEKMITDILNNYERYKKIETRKKPLFTPILDK